MARIENRGEEIVFIYNSDQFDNRRAFHYLKNIAGKKLKSIDIAKEKLSESQIIYLALEMNIDIPSLVDRSNKLLFHEIENGNLSNESLIKLLSLRPDFLRTPLILWNGKIEYWDMAYESFRREMESGHLFEKQK